MKTRIGQRILQLKRTTPVIFYTVVVLLFIELFGIFIAAHVLPDHFYISLYLPDHARINTDRHLDGTDKYNIRDSLLGWRNRPGCVYDKWQVDSLGSRSTHQFTTKPKKPTRIMLLGSSLINGGPFVEIGETITAYLEDSITECVNFGTMRYSLDQQYLYYKEHLHKYQPDILIVGLGTNPCEGLSNQYIPFRQRHATDMPFLKPRFVLKSDSLELIPVPPRWMHDSIFDRRDLFDYLKKSDHFYADFSVFKRLGVLPISRVGWFAYSKFRSLDRQSRENETGFKLLITLMDLFVREAEKNGASVIFLSMPNRVTAFPEGWRKFLPDLYGERLDRVRNHGFQVVDVRDMFQKSDKSYKQLYVYDDRHFTPLGNKIIAEKLKSVINFQLRKFAELPAAF